MGASYRRGQPPPDFIANAPELLPGLDLYFDAFWELTTCRSFIGMSGLPGPIPWSAIDAYAQRLGLEGEDLEHFTRLLRALDDELLDYTRSKEAGGKPGSVQQKDSNAR